jgi:hypothetical protein
MMLPYHNDARTTAISTSGDFGWRRNRAGISDSAGFRSTEVGRDSEKTQQGGDRQIVHMRGVENLAFDLLRPCAYRLFVCPVEEQFLVRPWPAAELFPERGKPMLRDQDQGAGYA